MPKKLHELDEDLTPAVSDLVLTTKNPLTTPVNKKVKISNFISSTLSTLDGYYLKLTTMSAAQGAELVGGGNTVLHSHISGVPYPSFTRLSVLSGDPNPATSLAAQTSVFVSPRYGDTYPQWTGTAFVPTTFSELVLYLQAQHTSGSLYDLYLWKDGASIRFVSGAAWSSATSRGTGAGTAETETLYGVQINKVSMTVRDANNTTYTMPARYGTLVGTMEMSANGQINWIPAHRCLWNKYNQLPAALFTCPGYVDDNTITL
jgi:hypothetical protein